MVVPALAFPRSWRLALLAFGGAACSGLPDVLPRAASTERDVPRPEERNAARAPLAPELTAFRLANGLRVTLLEDHALPEVVVDLALAVGTRDEGPGEGGYARLFE